MPISWLLTQTQPRYCCEGTLQMELRSNVTNQLTLNWTDNPGSLSGPNAITQTLKSSNRRLKSQYSSHEHM